MTRSCDDQARWFLADTARLHHDVQLICLPHAGGCASTYRDWLADLSAVVDVLPVQLPGRETRIREQFATDMGSLVDELTEVVRGSGFNQIALFGHSLGAMIAVKMCEAIELAGTKVAHMFVSGHRAPPPSAAFMRHRPGDPFSVPQGASDGRLLESLTALDGTLTQRLGSADLRELFLPVLRADMRLLTTAEFGGERVDAPVTALAGLQDPLLAGYDLMDWARVTRTGCAVYVLPGQHFYLGSQGPAIARLVRGRLREALGERPGADGQPGGSPGPAQ